MHDNASTSQELDAAAARSMLDGVAAEPSLLKINAAIRALPVLRPHLARVERKIACLASFTIDPVVPALRLSALREGIDAEAYVAPYGQFEQELINPNASLSSFDADVVILAVRLRDVLPDLYDCFNSLSSEQIAAWLDEWFGRLESALRSFRLRSKSPILMQNYELPAHAAAGIAEATTEPSQTMVLSEANRRLAALASSIENVRIVDYDRLLARVGRESWTDPRTGYLARIPVASRHYWTLASFYVRHLRPLAGLSRKVVVVDADNTLWGGVVGDVGVDGIALGTDFPGSAFVAFQKRLLDLYHRGVVLCLASKNEPGSVEEVLERHPAMVLRARHFAAMRVNWNAKPQNLQEIARELNLGLDSFVFIDDHPVECEMMRVQLPQVMTIQLPSDPAAYPGVVESLDVFDQWTISAEDRRRGELYRAEADRKTLQTQSVSLEDFYRRLEMKLTIGVNRAQDVARVAQLTARTNQFNMNTVRCSEDDIRGFMLNARQDVVTLALHDRFGDNGIVGAAVIDRGDTEHVLRLFLMSCRVLGRTVEQSFIRWIAGRARAAGADRLVGLYKPTPKNQPFAGFYSEMGFQEGAEDDGVRQWALALRDLDTQLPDWMQLSVDEQPR